MRFPAGAEVPLFSTASRPVLEPPQTPVQWVLRALFPGVKRPGHEPDCLPPSSIEVRKVWSSNSIPPYIVIVWCLIKHSDCNIKSTVWCGYLSVFLVTLWQKPCSGVVPHSWNITSCVIMTKHILHCLNDSLASSLCIKR